jgi:hypothetical protein
VTGRECSLTGGHSHHHPVVPTPGRSRGASLLAGCGCLRHARDVVGVSRARPPSRRSWRPWDATSGTLGQTAGPGTRTCSTATSRPVRTATLHSPKVLAAFLVCGGCPVRGHCPQESLRRVPVPLTEDLLDDHGARTSIRRKQSPCPMSTELRVRFSPLEARTCPHSGRTLTVFEPQFPIAAR